MNNVRAVPALPAAAATVAGILLAYYSPDVPLRISSAALAACVAALILFLRMPHLRVYPAFLALFVVATMCMTRAKERIHVPLPDRMTALKGVVTGRPRTTDRVKIFDLYVVGGQPKGKKITCRTPKENPCEIIIGGSYVVEGILFPIEHIGKHTNFDYVRWTESRSFSAEMYVGRWDMYAVGSCVSSLPFPERIVLKAKLLRERVLDMLAGEGISPDNFALLSAMALGERSSLPKQTRNIYAQTGVSHLLALSGLHLGIICALLVAVFMRRRASLSGSIIVVVSLWLYALLTGMSVSVIRAAIMFSVCVALAIDPRRRQSANALFVAITVMLLINPLSVWDIGFQLSVISVLAISLVYTPLYRLVSAEFLSRNLLFRWFWKYTVVSLAAQIGTFPLVLYYFGYVSFAFLAANLLAIPLVSALLYSVFISLAVWWLPIVRRVFVWVVSALCTALDWVLSHIAASGAGRIEHATINDTQLLLIYLTVIASVVIIRAVSRTIQERRNATAQL
ncbi:MAG: ComEC family competence protein [Prevotella sp.]|nr:ComEC family competence protein [Prevotella sp.]